MCRMADTRPVKHVIRRTSTVEGFWFVSWFVKDWTGHPNFPRPQPEMYYKNAIDRLNDLAYWFFMGESPYQEGHQFNPL